jgi:hypothetical protein
MGAVPKAREPTSLSPTAVPLKLMRLGFELKKAFELIDTLPIMLPGVDG